MTPDNLTTIKRIKKEKKKALK